MVECTVWWASPLVDVERYRALLTPVEDARFAGYRRDSDRQRFLTGRVLAKSVLGERLGLPAGEVEFEASCPDCGKQHGPPRLPGSDVAFSISHSGDRVGLALTAGTAVGLDVEGTGRRVDEALLSYALNETELAALRQLREAERGSAFFGYWARKEALMKATGRGLRVPLRGITLSGPGQPPRLVAASDPALLPERARLADLEAGAGYAGAVAVLGVAELTVRERWWNQGSGSGAFQPHGAAQGRELG